MPPADFAFEPTRVGRARIGRLETPHGPIDTPQFMPVGTQATVKALTPGDLRAAGAQMILGNTYHLGLRPTAERIARLGGLHRFMGWDGPILTDSGGFQVVSLAHRLRIDDDGLTFASHLDGATVRLTPERAMEIQALLGSDVAMVLDQPVDPVSPRAEVEEAMRRTHRWAERSLAARARPDQAVFGIIQGGIEPDLRRESAAVIAGIGFEGIAVGGLAGSETKEEMASALEVVAEALGDDPRVRYLMGVGSPPEFFTAVERGIDLFDSVLLTRVARTGQVWTDAGRLNLRNAAFLDDPAPIDAACACEACRGFSRAYLAHLFRARELLAYRLATLHNVTWTLELMRRLRASLVDGSFAEFRARVAAAFARPVVVGAWDSPRFSRGVRCCPPVSRRRRRSQRP
jgi:queuine tRNA-ribosyltransferase